MVSISPKNDFNVKKERRKDPFYLLENIRKPKNFILKKQKNPLINQAI